MQKKLKSGGDPLRPEALMMGCLVVVALLHMLTMIFGAKMSPEFQRFAIMLFNMTGALFLGAALTRRRNRTAGQLLLLGLVFCLWMGVLQIMDLQNYALGEPYDPRFAATTFLSEYLMLLPMAALLDEEGRDRGLRVFFCCFLVSIIVYIVFSLMLVTDSVPKLVEPLSRWFGTRLGLMWHPNVLAAYLLTGFGMTLTLGWSLKNRWFRLPALVLAGFEYYLMALTNTRTVTIMAACILGGLVFFHIYKNGSWKRFLVGLLAALLIICLMFTVASTVYSHHVQNFTTDSAELEAALRLAGQSTLREDLVGFTSRDGIWKGAFQALGDHPEVLFFGTRDIGNLISPYNAFWVAHAHNAWLQTLLGGGLVALGVALVLTFMAAKSILLIWFVKDSTMYQKIVGLLATAIMGSQFMEIYIFYTDYPRMGVQAAFLLCVGYLVYWANTLPDRKKKA